MSISLHASKRAQQRGVPPLIIDLLIQFGKREHDGHGAEIYFFDHRAKKHLQSYAGGLINKLSEQLDVYAIISEEKVITVGKRLKKVNHV